MRGSQLKGHFWITCYLRNVSCLIGTRLVIWPEWCFFARIITIDLQWDGSWDKTGHMASNYSITCQDMNSNNGFRPNQGFTAEWQTQFSIRQLPTRWYGAKLQHKWTFSQGYCSGSALLNPKQNLRKWVQLIQSKRKRKPRSRLRQNRGLKRKKKALGRLCPRTSVIHTYYHAVLLSLMIFLIRWVTQVFQPSLVWLAPKSLIKLSEITEQAWSSYQS
jgi:hypothetical protein